MMNIVNVGGNALLIFQFNMGVAGAALATVIARWVEMAYLLLRTYRHSQLILGSVFFGMIVLVAGQLIVEHVYSYAIPISVFITVGGGLYFLYLLLTRKKV